MPVPSIFYAELCESPVNYDGLFYHMIYQNGGSSDTMEFRNKDEVPHRLDRRKKSPEVSRALLTFFANFYVPIKISVNVDPTK